MRTTPNPDLTTPQRAFTSAVRPHNPDALHAWLVAVLDITVPRHAICPTSTPPFDYLIHTFFEPAPFPSTHAPPHTPTQPCPAPNHPRDALVWANRGGGKTFYAAIATILDLIFKPGIEIKCIAGSLEQAARMHEHIRTFLERPALQWMIDSDSPAPASAGARPARSRIGITERRIILGNHSRCDILAQSQTAVRGTRPQKLRCDEVELFDPDIWQAAQLVTRSKHTPEGQTYHAAIEALSTMHEPHGLMATLIEQSQPPTLSSSSPLVPDARCLMPSSSPSSRIPDPGSLMPAPVPKARRLLRWSAIDVLEPCPPHRDCAACPLEPECAGRAKTSGAGHLHIDDAIQQKSRVDTATWEAEMLCLRPRRSSAVFPEFEDHIHIIDADPPLPAPPTPPHPLTPRPIPPPIAPSTRHHDHTNTHAHPITLCAMDFGFRNPTIVLWAINHPGGALHIVDELVQREALLQRAIDAMLHGAPPTPTTTPDDKPRPHTCPPAQPNRPRWPIPEWVAIDPAGRQRSEQTGISAATMLTRAGLNPRAKPARIEPGLAAIRARLRPANPADPPTLYIHRRCQTLINAMHAYRYPPNNPNTTTPLKDGHDHPIDALRYLLTNLERPGTRMVMSW